MLTIRRMCFAEAGVLFSLGLRVGKASKGPGGRKDEVISSCTTLFPGRLHTQMRALKTRSLSKLKVCATVFRPQFPDRRESRFLQPCSITNLIHFVVQQIRNSFLSESERCLTIRANGFLITFQTGDQGYLLLVASALQGTANKSSF